MFEEEDVSPFANHFSTYHNPGFFITPIPGYVVSVALNEAIPGKRYCHLEIQKDLWFLNRLIPQPFLRVEKGSSLW
jgi:hypothetical protein